jgi:hypothetical protein
MSNASLFHEEQNKGHIVNKKLALQKAHLRRKRKHLPTNHKGALARGIVDSLKRTCMWKDTALCDSIAEKSSQAFKSGFSIDALLNYLGSQVVINMEETYCKGIYRKAQDNCMCHKMFSDTFASKQSDGSCPLGYIDAVGSQCYKQHQPMHEFGMCNMSCASCIKDESEQTEDADQPSDVCALEQVPANCTSTQKCSVTEGDFWLALSKMSCHCKTLRAAACASDHACTWVLGDNQESSKACGPYEARLECERKCSVDTDKTSWECGCICGAIIAHEANAGNKVCPHETFGPKSDLNSWLRATGKPALYSKKTKKYEFNIRGKQMIFGSPGMQCDDYKWNNRIMRRRAFRDWVQGNWSGPQYWNKRKRWPQSWSRKPYGYWEETFVNRMTRPWHWCHNLWTTKLWYRHYLQRQRHPFFTDYVKYAFDGCMDSSADNYVNTAVYQPANSCIFYGCNAQHADNYNAKVTHPDGSCIFYGCTDDTAENYLTIANHDDGSCIFKGCTDDTAKNYNENATHTDGSCIFNCTTDVDCPDYEGQEQYCLVGSGECSTVAGSGGDPGDLEGCTDPNAKNYNENATHADGSCIAK